MSAPSMLMTIGTILDRAAANSVPVSLTVNGSTTGLSGVVIGRDGEGVALVSDVDYIVVRLSEITSVRVLARSVDLAPAERAS